MRKLARRLSGSSSGGRSSKRLDVASLNRGFDEVDGPEKGKSNKRPATSEPTSPSGRPTAWGERLPAEELAAVKMQAAARGKRARKSMGSRKGLGVIGELEEEPTPSDSPIASAAGAFAAFLKQPVAAVDAAAAPSSDPWRRSTPPLPASSWLGNLGGMMTCCASGRSK